MPKISPRTTGIASRMLSQKKTMATMPSTKPAMALPLPVFGCG